MKNFIKSLAFTLAAGAFFSSCEQDPCKDVVCGTNGSCVEGTCNCEAGYEKDAANLCNTMQRAKFIGAWTVAEDCAGATAAYPSAIAAGTTSITEVSILDFWATFTNAVKATVNANDTKAITIARQEPDMDGYFVSGSGMINAAGALVINFTVTAETGGTVAVPGTVTSTQTCTATYTK